MLNLPNEAQIEGNRIAWGKVGVGPPLVAIHGTPFSSQVWRRIVPHLKDRCTVYYFDLAGYGQSEQRADQDVSLGIQNRILAGLFETWQITRPHVLAHDFGAATALRATLLDGLQYASLTLFDAVALSPWGSAFVQHVRQHEAAFAGMPAYMHEALLDAYLQTAAHETLSKESLEIYKKPWMGELGQPAFYRQISQMDQSFTQEVETKLMRFDHPTTVLWGEEDNWLPISQGVQLAGQISELPLQRVSGAGHLMQEDRPEAIVAATLNTIARAGTYS